MNATAQLQLLRDIHRDKLSLLKRHIAAAQHVSHYDFNNTYQYIIAREDVHVRWLADAIGDMGAGPDDVAEPTISVTGKREAAQTDVIRQDRDGAQAFLDKWKAPIEKIANARHKTMLRLMMGETLEQKRFFEQMLGGRTDLLGARADGAGTGGGVMATRWIDND